MLHSPTGPIQSLDVMPDFSPIGEETSGVLKLFQPDEDSAMSKAQMRKSAFNKGQGFEACEDLFDSDWTDDGERKIAIDSNEFGTRGDEDDGMLKS